MAPTKLNYLFLAVAAIILLSAVQSPSVEARKFIGVNPWCHTANHKRLCTRMVKNATTWHDASINCLRTTLEYAKRLPSLVNPMVKPAISGLELKTQNSILETCVDDFETDVYDMEKSLEALLVQDVGTVYSRLSASFNQDCVEALAEFHIDSPISNYSKLFRKEVDNCMAVLQQT